MAFQSLNTRDLQAPPLKKRVCLNPHDLWAESFDPKVWYDYSAGLSAVSYTTEQLEAMVKSMHRRNYRSSYYWSFGIDPATRLSNRSALDEMMLQMDNLYFGTNRTKIPPPLPTSKRVMGFGTEESYRTPLTFYEKYHSFVGYNVIKNNQMRAAEAEARELAVKAAPGPADASPVTDDGTVAAHSAAAAAPSADETDQTEAAGPSASATTEQFCPRRGQFYTMIRSQPMKGTFVFDKKMKPRH